MNKNFKKLLSVILCVVLLFTTASVAFAEDENTRTVVDSGFCGADGENLTWTLYDDGELVISGEGEMDWYYVGTDETSKLAPWSDHYDKIDVITVEEGVTSIGHQAFSSNPGEYTRFYRINFPKSLQFIEYNLFHYTENNRVPGQHLAYCYPGSESEWKQVKEMNSVIHVEKMEGKDQYLPVERTFDGTTYRKWITPKGNYEKLYYNGEEPQAFCELVKDSTYNIDMIAHYYPGEARAEKLIWYTIHNGKERKIGEMNVGEFDVDTMMVSTYKAGDHYLRVDVVDDSGKVIVASEDLLIASVPSFSTRVDQFASGMKLFFAEIVYVLWLFVGLPIFGIVALPIIKILDLIGYEF